jgi:hypothetical protein
MPIEPAATLVEPPAEPDHIMDTVGNILGFAQNLSLSYWAGEAAKKVCGCNPWEWAAQQFAGDWHLVMRASIAVGNLARFNAAFAEPSGRRPIHCSPEPGPAIGPPRPTSISTS